MSSPALAERPAPLTRSADWMVLGLLVAALVLAWFLRQQSLFATESASAQGVQITVPAGSLPLDGDNTLALLSPDGMLLRVELLALPPIGSEDMSGLVTSRALNQAGAYEVYRTIGSDTATVAGQPAGTLEYAYVMADNESFFASDLEIIHGYEALVPRPDGLYVFTLEAPESQLAEVEAYWPRFLEGVRFTEGGS